MVELVDRVEEKRRAREVLRSAAVPAKAMTALYLGLCLVLDLIDRMSGESIVGTFITILTSLLAAVLGAGFVMYCMAVRRGERAEYLTLFDGFSFVGKIVCLHIVQTFFIALWSMLLVIPGIIAAYRYSFAEYNLYENPGISVMEAMDMSKQQTVGYKSYLFLLDLSYLGWSLLASLPAFIVAMLCYQQYFEILETVQAGMVPDFNINPAAYLGMPVLAWSLLQYLWSIIVALFYYPQRTCVQLSYFEAAKRTSGIPGTGGDGWTDGWSSGPDGLDGF